MCEYDAISNGIIGNFTGKVVVCVAEIILYNEYNTVDGFWSLRVRRFDFEALFGLGMSAC